MEQIGIISVSIFISEQDVDLMNRCLMDLCQAPIDLKTIQPKYSGLTWSLFQTQDKIVNVQISKYAFVMLNQLCRMPKLNTVIQQQEIL